MAAVQNAGLALEWVKGMLMAGWQELYGSLESVLPGCEKLYFLPYLTVERAHQPYSKQGGAFLGLRPHHTREHLLRASLEGVAYGIRAAFDTLPGIDKTNFLQLAGGGSVPKGWRQLLADVLNRELHLVETADVSARGAALLAGIATGIWENAAATLPLAPAISEIAVPDRQKVILYEELYRRFRSLSDQISPYQ
jgi:xylulokinase